MELLEWQNLIFLIPIAFGLCFVLGAVCGIGAETDHDVEHEVDHDVDHDVSADSDADHDADGEHDHDGVEHDHEHHPAVWAKAFELLGVGRVPISVVLMVMSLVFGITGFVMNTILKSALVTPLLYAPAAAGIALFAMLFTTGFVSNALAKIMPTSETYPVRKRDLVGSYGVVTLKTDQEFGRVQVRDKYGSLHEVVCTAKEGVILSGGEVVLVSYDQAKDRYQVVPSPVAEEPRATA